MPECKICAARSDLFCCWSCTELRARPGHGSKFVPTVWQVRVSEIWEEQGAVLKPLPPDQERCAQHQLSSAASAAWSLPPLTTPAPGR
jgi:hypothetical protein